MDKASYVDEFLDRLYCCGHKEDGEYKLSLSEATLAAENMFIEHQKLINMIENLYINHKIKSTDAFLKHHEQEILEIIKDNKHE